MRKSIPAFLILFLLIGWNVIFAETPPSEVMDPNTSPNYIHDQASPPNPNNSANYIHDQSSLPSRGEDRPPMGAPPNNNKVVINFPQRDAGSDLPDIGKITYPFKLPSTGNSKITIPSLTMTNSDGPNIVATGVELVNSYDLKSITENHRHVQINMQNLQITNIPFPINGSLNLVINVDNVNLEILQKLYTLIRMMQSKELNESQKRIISLQFKQLIPQVVTNNFNFSLDEIYNTPQGALVNVIKLAYPENVPLPTNASDLQKNLKGSMVFKISISLFENYLAQLAATPDGIPTFPGSPPASPVSNESTANAAAFKQMISMVVKQSMNTWLTQGYVVKDQNNYLVSITLENGEFRINGKPLNQIIPNPRVNLSLPPNPQPNSLPEPQQNQLP